ncbi:MAG: TRAP transporter large permease [Thermodesulfobacteriota bacterium]
MTPEVITLLGLMILLIVLGLPLFLSIGCSSLVTILIFYRHLPLEMIPQYIVGGTDSFALLAIPFFFLAGEIMNSSGMTERIVRFSEGLVGGIRGGLAHVNVVTNMIYAGISGSAVADAAAIGSFMIPSMVRSGYPPGFSAAINAAAATIGPIIPPSIPMILYGVIANVSVGQLFLSGVFPGLIMGIYLMVVAFFISARRGYPKGKFLPFHEILHLAIRVSLALLSPVIIVGGILLGVFTATEAGAVAVLYSILIGFFFYRELTVKNLWEIFKRSVVSTGSILIIVGVSYLFGWIIAQSNIANKIGEIILSISMNKNVVLLELMIFFLIVGMFMDPLAALIIFVPIFLPMVNSLGIHPVHFGLITVLNLMIGLLTPPIGYLLYVTASISGEKVEKVIQESLPFIIALLIVLLICIFWPSMVLYLPNLVGR